MKLDHSTPPLPDEVLIEVIRDILLTREREALARLEEEIRTAATRLETIQQTLLHEIQALRDELGTLEQQLDAPLAEIEHLRERLDALEARVRTDAEQLMPTLVHLLPDLISERIRNDPDTLAEAIGPIMGEAIRVQIRESRAEMVEALYPIIGSVVQRALAEFARELQQNIDARLRQTVSERGIFRTIRARLRGVAPSELVLRDALPFALQQIFLIHTRSGLLIEHLNLSDDVEDDADLIGSMLTAIRAFVRDSFGDDEDDELGEIQFGDETIIVQNGTDAYLAVVVQGIPPEGFRAHLRDFIAALHVHYGQALRTFDTTPDTLPSLQPELQRLAAELNTLHHHAPTTPETGRTFSRPLVIGCGAGALTMLMLTCAFYLWLTWKVLPLVLAAPHPTITPAPIATAPPVPTLTATPTMLPTQTPSPTPTPTTPPTLTPSPSPSSTPLPTPQPSPTVSPTVGQATGNVWVRDIPDLNAERREVLFAGTRVQILASDEEWALVAWEDDAGERREGWVPSVWIVESTQP